MRRFAGDDVRGRLARAGKRGESGKTANSSASATALLHSDWDETSTTNVYPASLVEPAAVGKSPPAGPIQAGSERELAE